VEEYTAHVSCVLSRKVTRIFESKMAYFRRQEFLLMPVFRLTNYKWFGVLVKMVSKLTTLRIPIAQTLSLVIPVNK